MIPAFFLWGCSESTPKSSRNIEAKLVYNKELFGLDLNLIVINSTKKPLCLLRREITPTSPYFQVTQNGAVIAPQNGANSEVVMFNGVNISEGLEVVPSGKRNFYINIGDFPLKPGPFSASVRFTVINCSDLFSEISHSPQIFNANVTGTIPTH